MLIQQFETELNNLNNEISIYKLPKLNSHYYSKIIFKTCLLNQKNSRIKKIIDNFKVRLSFD